jgi:hypothetical protein
MFLHSTQIAVMSANNIILQRIIISLCVSESDGNKIPQIRFINVKIINKFSLAVLLRHNLGCQPFSEVTETTFYPQANWTDISGKN